MKKVALHLRSEGNAVDDSLRDAEIALEQDRNICPECGVPQLQDAKICNNCGHKLDTSPSKIAQPKERFPSRLRRFLHIRH